MESRTQIAVESPFDNFTASRHHSGYRTMSSFDPLITDVNQLRREDFEIGIVCALKRERDAVQAQMTIVSEDLCKIPNDPNAYTYGVLGGKAVVLPYPSQMGKSSAATVATNMRRSFENIKIVLLVGIAGGAHKSPDGLDILLGDLIIGKAVIQYDFARQYSDRLKRKSDTETNLGRGPPEIANFLAFLSAERTTEDLIEKTEEYSQTSKAVYPGIDKDYLFPSEYRHKHQVQQQCKICDACTEPHHRVCEKAEQASCDELGCKRPASRRQILSTENPPKAQIHFGRIASGDSVIKSAVHRDMLTMLNKVIGFEMEVAGLWNDHPTLIIKAVCDYADSHKNKEWQDYAAAKAAACARAILEKWKLSNRPAISAHNSSQMTYGTSQLSNPLSVVASGIPSALTGSSATPPSFIASKSKDIVTYDVNMTIPRPYSKPDCCYHSLGLPAQWKLAEIESRLLRCKHCKRYLCEKCAKSAMDSQSNTHEADHKLSDWKPKYMYFLDKNAAADDIRVHDESEDLANHARSFVQGRLLKASYRHTETIGDQVTEQTRSRVCCRVSPAPGKYKMVVKVRHEEEISSTNKAAIGVLRSMNKQIGITKLGELKVKVSTIATDRNSHDDEDFAQESEHNKLRLKKVARSKITHLKFDEIQVSKNHPVELELKATYDTDVFTKGPPFSWGLLQISFIPIDDYYRRSDDHDMERMKERRSERRKQRMSAVLKHVRQFSDFCVEHSEELLHLATSLTKCVTAVHEEKQKQSAPKRPPLSDKSSHSTTVAK